MRSAELIVEDDKGPLIQQILEFAILNYEECKYNKQDIESLIRLRNQYVIRTGDHKIKADHAIIQIWNSRAILIVEDELEEIENGIIQSFDQLRTYSLSDEGKEFPIFYGIVSTFTEWIFCCYIPPEENKIATEDSFYTSERFRLTIDLETTSSKKDNFDKLIGMIKGFLIPDADISIAVK